MLLDTVIDKHVTIIFCRKFLKIISCKKSLGGSEKLYPKTNEYMPKSRKTIMCLYIDMISCRRDVFVLQYCSICYQMNQQISTKFVL